MDHVRRYNVERSCLRCHERKVRCDKGTPCNKCVNLQVPCEYPGPKRVKRRPPRNTVAEVMARLEQIEHSIAGIATGPSRSEPRPNTSDDAVSVASSELSAPLHPRHADQPRHGFLGKDGSYIDEPLISRVFEKESELQSAIGTPTSDNSAPKKPPRLKVDGILTNPLQLQSDFRALYPNRWRETALWETFLSRVDPVLKVIHVPTTRPRIFSAISRPDACRPDIHCLLFAIFFAATTALVSDEPDNETLRSDLRRYQQGLELAMYYSSFLDAPTVTSLQAMAIYLTCLRYTNSGRSGFTLRGLTIRAAQSIGLHRDGKNFKLSPLECELRRRLWWNLYSTDARMAEDHGITVAEQEFDGDTHLSSNIDDKDLDEKATEYVHSQHRWTETSFSLIIAEINRMWLPIAHASNCPSGADPEKLFRQLKEHLYEKYLQYADMDIPIQRQGVHCAQVLISKAEVHMRQKVLQNQGVASSIVDQTATEQLLLMACDGVELGLDMFIDELLRGFRWLTSTYTQFHLLTYILWHLCVYPAGPHVKRAWHAVNRHFDLSERDPAWPDPGPKWPMLVQLRVKALRIRQVNSPGQSEQLQLPEGSSGSFEEGALQTTEAALLEIDNWDLNWLDYPDWNYLAQSIAIMGQEGIQVTGISSFFCITLIKHLKWAFQPKIQRQKAPLDSAIDTVSEKTLREVFKSICASCPDAKHEAGKQLLVAETDVKKRKKSSAPALESQTPSETPKEKKQVPRYAFCDNCKGQFDVSTNTSTSCTYHPRRAMATGEELFVDNDEDVDDDDPDLREEWPHCFTFGCCDGNLRDNPHGCETDWHREQEPTAKRLRVF